MSVGPSPLSYNLSLVLVTLSFKIELEDGSSGWKLNFTKRLIYGIRKVRKDKQAIANFQCNFDQSEDEIA